MTKLEETQAGWKVQALGLTGWMTKREYEECVAAWNELTQNEQALDDVWMMYVDARWNAYGGEHDRAVVVAKRWLAMMTGKITLEEFEAES